eukprot:gnl/TRDRNA2_/TRDRNA2_171551_c0_seq2.p1 gnl/TRDRNA2_/TRDRNA2_171551_c0~~gnl/TRDRNA2_/TRDRNA2_171551_c0_seq2.p1  ORF type:complete len:255 (+),score=31.96 gnl/TRDRNA2_/TRDRNA2_171551_c0_seq2:66-830(+)
MRGHHVSAQHGREEQEKKPFAWMSDSDGSSPAKSRKVSSMSSSSGTSSGNSEKDAVEPLATEPLVVTTTFSGHGVSYEEHREATAAEPQAQGGATVLPEPGICPRWLRRSMHRVARLQASSGNGSVACEVARQLRKRGVAVMEQVMGAEFAAKLHELAVGLDGRGSLKPGALGGAWSSRPLRGDRVCFLEDAGITLAGLPDLVAKLDNLVAALRSLLCRPGELQHTSLREPAMLSCFPPGARYIRHYDNNCEVL